MYLQSLTNNTLQSFALSDLNFGNKAVLFVYLVILLSLFAACVTYNSSSKAKNDVFEKLNL